MKLFIVIIMLISTLFAENASLKKAQLANFKLAYSTGGKLVLPDGDDLALTLATLSFRETSFMTNVPVRYSEKFYINVNNKKQYVKITQKFDESKKQILKFKGKDYVVNREIFYSDESTGPMEMKLSTVKELIRTQSSLKKFRYALNDRAELLKLMHNKETALILAGNLIIKMYKESQAKYGKGSQNLAIAIQRYNGGWSNPRYLSKFRQDRMFVKHLVMRYRLTKA